jgi:amino-acid N-acetyltransferase
MTTNNKDFVTWFRNASSYIYQHRSKTFVILLPSIALDRNNSLHIIHDLCLLVSLNIKLVVVIDIADEILAQLAQQDITPQLDQGKLVVDDKLLQDIRNLSSNRLGQVESWLSMGAVNNPLSGIKIRTTTGNFISAQPHAITNGVNFGNLGGIKNIDSDAISLALNNNQLVLLNSLGYSSTGDILYLDAGSIASSSACALGADKLILLIAQDGIYQGDTLVREIQGTQMQAYLADNSLNNTYLLQAALDACNNGVGRCHFISYHNHKALLEELFTCDGYGTLLTSNAHEQIAPASAGDILNILAITQPLEQTGALVPRSSELLHLEIENFFVLKRDEIVIACCALAQVDEHNGEIYCLAVHPDYLGAERGTKLLQHVINQAQAKGLEKIFLLTTSSLQWFKERGFKSINFTQLPQTTQKAYNKERCSCVLALDLINIK